MTTTWGAWPPQDRARFYAKADALLSSGVLVDAADVRARAQGAAADEIRTSVSYGAELRPDGTEDPLMAAYVEGVRDSYAIVRDRAVSEREGTSDG